MISNFIRYSLIILFSVCLLSCKQNEEYYKYIFISQNIWPLDDALCFEFDSVSFDINHRYEVSFEITHNVKYAYENLWLYIDQTLDDSILSRDTIECKLVNDAGRWIGSGNGATRHVSYKYKTNLKLDSVKQYKVCINHAMQDIQLKGVERIGLKLY
ncbi:MAG: gliding motility lipoprotein GldH [Dysgonamonadaceae bacterium]|nr:gliding motility lipoprotein GldH [Dysgonamonadaceae bacterium]MDD4728625.1 gliding motility lipoprotein GldH [Dysgonamonadaceae bacterium]